MRILCKYENGSEFTTKIEGPIIPQIFTLTGNIDGEPLVVFYFEYSDELPSGALFYKEVSKEHVQRTLRGEGGS